MKGWNLGGQPDLLLENASGGLIINNEIADIADVSMEPCPSLRE